MEKFHIADIPKTDRITHLVDNLYAKMPVIESARAKLVTESYKETEDEPIITRRAKAFAHILHNIPIIIREKGTPVPPIPTPVVPAVVDNVIYNAAPEHEQALIRGVREWCNVRAGAGTNSAVIGRANLGQQISLLRWNADESWCFVEFNGLQGWIAKQFILPIK